MYTLPIFTSHNKFRQQKQLVSAKNGNIRNINIFSYKKSQCITIKLQLTTL